MSGTRQLYQPKGTVGIIDLIPDGDLMVVLTHYQHDHNQPTIAKLLDELAPVWQKSSAKSTALPEELHVRVQLQGLQAAGKKFQFRLRQHSDPKVLADGTQVYKDDEDLAIPALFIYCNIFWKAGLCPEKIRLGLISKVCIMVEKYRYNDALRNTVQLWVKNNTEQFDTIESVERGFCIAYVLRDDKMFREVAKDLLLRVSATTVHMEGKPCTNELLTAINSAQQTNRQEFHRRLGAAIEALKKDLHSPSSGPFTTLYQRRLAEGALQNFFKNYHHSDCFVRQDEKRVILAKAKSISEGRAEVKRISDSVLQEIGRHNQSLDGTVSLWFASIVDRHMLKIGAMIESCADVVMKAW